MRGQQLFATRSGDPMLLKAPYWRRKNAPCFAFVNGECQLELVSNVGEREAAKVKSLIRQLQ